MASRNFCLRYGPALLSLLLTGVGFSQQIPIAIKKVEGAPTGAKATAIIQSALAQSGYFRMVPNPAGIASTEATLSGTGMKGRLLGPDGTKVFERTYTRGNFELDALQFADDIALTLTKFPGIATSQIFFVVTRGSQRHIYVCDYDGRNARPLIGSAEANVAPAVSADGKHVAYSALNRGLGDLTVFDLASNQTQKLSEKPVFFAQSAWAPDGKSLAVAMASVPNQNADLFLIKLRGPRKPKAILETPVSESVPSWSPDGNLIVYTAPIGTNQTGLFTLKPDAVSPKPVPVPTGFPNASSPSWSPDGNRIAFVSTSPQGGKSVCITFPKGNGKPQKLADGFDPAWGANSRHLVYSTGRELRRLDTGTGKSVTLVRNVGPISEPDWTR